MSRCVATPFPHSYSPSPFRQPTQRTEKAANSRRPEQEGQVAREEQPDPGPSAGYESQLEDLLAESFGRVRSPMAGINEDDEPVEDDGLCYVQERSVLLMTLEQVLTDSARPFRFPFRWGAAPDPSSVNDSSSLRGGEEANSPGAVRKQKKPGKRSSGWRKLRARISKLFSHKSAPDLATRNEPPLAAGAAPSPSEPRFANRFALMRDARRKSTTMGL